jgi:lipopolysaccharide transport system permease protein
MQQNEEEWTEVISSERGIFDLRLDELWRYRDLVLIFVKRDFVATYKQTILGPVWHFIRPLITTLLFTIVFGNIAKISTDGMPPFLFYLAGNVMWGYFARCLTSTANTFQANSAIFGKVYFPRLAVPVSAVISGLMQFVVQFLLFVLVLGYYYFFEQTSIVVRTEAILFLPVIVLMTAFFGLGIGVIISALTTKYKDLQVLFEFGVQLFMYMTPVIYPLSALGEKYAQLALLNPLTVLFEAFRYAFLGTGFIGLPESLLSTGIIFLVFFAGIIFFNKVEKNFMDTI